LQVTTPLTIDAPANSAGNSDHGFMKKLKEFDGLAMSISNNKVGSAEHSSSEHRSSQRFVKLASTLPNSERYIESNVVLISIAPRMMALAMVVMVIQLGYGLILSTLN